MYNAANKAPLALVLALSLPLAACGKSEDAAPKQAAGGELLERSVSDDMLPYDSLRSQPSLADPDAALYGEGNGESSRRSAPQAVASDEADNALVDAPATPATPTPSATPGTTAQ